MSAPIMLSMLMSAIYNLVDSIYVAQVSELDFLALSYAYPVQLMMVAFCAGTGVGFMPCSPSAWGLGRGRRPTGWPVTAFVLWAVLAAVPGLRPAGCAPLFRLSTDNAAVAAAGTSICASAAACPSGCVCSSSPSACSRPPATPPAL